MQEQPTISIIGAGVSGLCAAIHLKNNGYKAHIYESSNSIGGRLGTDYRDKMILDHGFQVLLDSYPAAQEFLDLEALQLIKFAPGAHIFHKGKKSTVGDPTRDASLLFATVISRVGSVTDKLRIFKLSRKLKKKSLKDIFEAPETTTLDYLRQQGFSNQIIEHFFRPFYAGIFLEPHLQTSSRMFEFVFKMFATGSATLPSRGIAAIPEQLEQRIEKGSISLNTAVERVVGSEITFADGSKTTSHYTLIATRADQIVPNLPLSNMKWHEVTVLYFKVSQVSFNKPIIGLLSEPETLVNNFHFLHDVFPDHPQAISISIVGDRPANSQNIEEKVRQEMKQHCDIHLDDLIDIKRIKKALPNLKNINYSMSSTETQLTENVFLAGDHLSNGSLNAAMLNGKAAAQAIIDKIENKVIVG